MSPPSRGAELKVSAAGDARYSIKVSRHSLGEGGELGWYRGSHQASRPNKGEGLFCCRCSESSKDSNGSKDSNSSNGNYNSNGSQDSYEMGA